MQLDYLIHSANMMAGAIDYEANNGLRIDPKSLGVYLAHGCHALSKLVEEPDLNDIIISSKANFDERREGILSEIQNIDAFINNFRVVDKALMVEAGMDPTIANYIFYDSELIYRTLNSGSEDGLYEVVDRLKRLRDRVCHEGVIKGQPLLFGVFRLGVIKGQP